MTPYLGMSQSNGKTITDTDHLRQSVRDIFMTPQGSCIVPRENMAPFHPCCVDFCWFSIVATAKYLQVFCYRISHR